MKLFDGKKIAEHILQDLKKEIKKSGTKPALAVILVGDNPESLLYISLKEKAASQVGIDFAKFRFPQGTSAGDIKKKIQELNQDKKINGILVQLPLPASYNQDEIIFQIDPQKDVDGFHPKNRYLTPPLIGAILFAFRESGNLSGKKAVALVNSEVFGRALKKFLAGEGLASRYYIKSNCSILELEGKLRSTDILITACGCPGMVTKDIIKNGAVLIDAGFSKVAEKKVRGDVDAESVKNKASFLTPVPGGIGPVTVALLLKNVFLASKFKKEDRHIRISEDR